MQSQQVNIQGLHTSATLSKLPAVILAGLFSIHCKVSWLSLSYSRFCVWLLTACMSKILSSSAIA
jgi:hypothetical protein